jgi:DNA modification methylase
MIEMWDGAFGSLSAEAADALGCEDGSLAFEAMHKVLDPVWQECHRVLIPGGIACINVGDASRTIAGVFQLYSNHSRIITSMVRCGFQVLPDILWRKPTNAPNKFMGSGMLPPGAYVTYEHEYILIFRKGDKRSFAAPEEKSNRSQSAYFWEERNLWFSDIWSDLKGIRQTTSEAKSRSRSAAYPFELAYRLIQMFSVYGDHVLDPFLGLGTTLAATVAAGRNGIGVEIEPTLLDDVRMSLSASVQLGRDRARQRLSDHRAWALARQLGGKSLKHRNEVHDIPVMTLQESQLSLYEPIALATTGDYEFAFEHALVPSSVARAKATPPQTAE